jgi:branched-subunit amino acid aminotransferase/4-amino-4-deoxychorismate lyase
MDIPDRIEIDGRSARVHDLWGAVFGHGHFTAMQVRGGRTRGLDLHLRRLEAATQELFERGLDGDVVRERIRRALGDTQDASIRVYVFLPDREPSVIVTVRPPGGIPTAPQRLELVRFQRPQAHLKHVGFVHVDHTELARAHGFAGAVLVTSDGHISEAAIANIGFFEGSTVVWPDAPHLDGITMQLLERTLAERGTPSRRAPVRLTDVPALDGAFLSNARGIVPVGSLGDVALTVNAERMRSLHDAYGSVSWDEI